MPSNGYVYTRGQNVTKAPAPESPTWADQTLIEDENVGGVCSWTDTGDCIAVACTDAGAEIVNNGALGVAVSGVSPSNVGYITHAGGFQKACKVGDYLYLLDDNAGIYQVDISAIDCQTANGDLTGAEALWASTVSSVLPSNAPYDMHGWVGTGAMAGKDYLLVGCALTGVSGYPYNDLARLTIITITSSTGAIVSHYDTADAYVQPGVVKGRDGQFLLSSGPIASVYYDGLESVVADGWRIDTSVAGPMGDDFSGVSLLGWSKYVDAAATSGSITLDTARMKLIIQSDNDAGTVRSVRAFRTGFFSGDFTLDVNYALTMPTDAYFNNGVEMYFGLTVGAIHQNDTVTYARRNYKASGTLNKYMSWVRNAGAWTNTAFTDDDAWLRIVRTGTNIELWYRAGDVGDFTQWGSAPIITDFPNSTPCYVRIMAASNFKNGGGAGAAYDFTCYCEELVYQRGGALTAHPYDLPCDSNIIDLAFSKDTSSGSGPTVAVAYTDDGATTGGVYIVGVDADTTTFATEDHSTVTQVRSTLTTKTATALACTSDAAYHAPASANNDGFILYGTAAGIEEINLTDLAVVVRTATTDQPVIGNTIQCVTDYGDESWVYGTDTGGGFLDVDTDAPTDATVYSHAEENTKYVTGAWEVPTELDAIEANVYVREYDGITGWPSYTLLATIDNDDAIGGALAAMDTARSNDSAYQYKITQVDEAGNESAGTTFTKYLGPPNGVSVTIYDPDTLSTTVTYTRAVRVKVSANSGGGDLGGVADAVKYVKILENGEAWADAALQLYDSSKYYELELSTGYGNKTVVAKFYAENLDTDTGAQAQATIAYSSGSAATTMTAQNVVLLHDFAGDYATVTGSNISTTFAADNTQDDRLGIKAISDGTVTSCGITHDFLSNQTTRYYGVFGHNFHELTWLAGDTAYLGYAVNGAPSVWTEVDITSLCSQSTYRPIIIDLESTSARYVRIRLSLTLAQTVKIGRIAVSTDTYGGVIQPQYNHSDGLEYGFKAVYSSLNESDSAHYAVNHRNGKRARLSFSDVLEADKRAILDAYEVSGRHKAIVVIGKPEIIPTLSSPAWSSLEASYEANNQVIYGWFANDSLTPIIVVNDYASFDVGIEGAVD